MNVRYSLFAIAIAASVLSDPAAAVGSPIVCTISPYVKKTTTEAVVQVPNGRLAVLPTNQPAQFEFKFNEAKRGWTIRALPVAGTGLRGGWLNTPRNVNNGELRRDPSEKNARAFLIDRDDNGADYILATFEGGQWSMEGSLRVTSLVKRPRDKMFRLEGPACDVSALMRRP